VLLPIPLEFWQVEWIRGLGGCFKRLKTLKNYSEAQLERYPFHGNQDYNPIITRTCQKIEKLVGFQGIRRVS